MKLIKYFISFYKPHKKLFFADMFCALVLAAADLFYPFITKNVINKYVPDKNLRMIIIWACVLLAIYIVKAGMNYIVSYYGHIVGVRIQGDMRRDMFRQLQKLPFSYYDDNKTGAITSRLVNDLFDVSELAHHGPENLFLSAIMFVGSFIMLASISVPLTLIVFSILPFIVFFAVKARHKMHAAFKASREQTAVINADIETAVSGIRVSRAYVAEENENAKFDRENEKFKAIRKKTYKAMGEFDTVMTFFTDFLYVMVLTSGGLFFYYGKIDIGEFTAFLLYIGMFLNPIKRFIALFEQLQEGMTGFRRFSEVMETETETDDPDAKDISEPKGDITFDHVSFKYNDENGESGKLVVNDLSLHISNGETVALVGPSGGGKTTICNLIPRFYNPMSGTIYLDGTDITKITRHSLRSSIGIVSQDVFLFNGTVRENIAYGNLSATDEQIAEAAKKARIHDYIMTLENGYDTNVGERGVKLSGGQKQRISIARVFLKNPSVLILDEATSALDNITEMQIQEALAELSRGRTVIVVAHRLSTVRNADEIIVITENGITERGSHDKLIADKGYYYKLYTSRT